MEAPCIKHLKVALIDLWGTFMEPLGFRERTLRTYGLHAPWALPMLTLCNTLGLDPESFLRH